MIHRNCVFLAIAGLSPILSGCTQPTTGSSKQVVAGAPVFVSMTRNGYQDFQRIDMGLKLAGFSLDEGRDVILFFNVKGVEVPTKGYNEIFAFGANEPIKKQLANLIDRGAEVHVCPICMKALKVEEADLVAGAKVTTRESLFAHISADTVAFTY